MNKKKSFKHLKIMHNFYSLPTHLSTYLPTRLRYDSVSKKLLKVDVADDRVKP